MATNKTKVTTFQDYMKHRVLPKFETNTAVADALNLSGSRVGYWLKGEGTPSETNCVQLANIMRDDPIYVLRLAGHNEMADALAEYVSGHITTPSADQMTLWKQLQELRDVMDRIGGPPTK